MENRRLSADMKEIILLITIHENPHGASEREVRVRATEFEECLAANCKTDIDRIIVFFEGENTFGYPSLAHEKVEVIPIQKRPTYKMFFDYANEHLAGNFVIISNADIYFDPKTPVHRVREIKPDHLWAVTRYVLNVETGSWGLQGRGLYGSYDSYIFHAPLKTFENDFTIGVTGCDGCLVQNALKALIPVSNPCRSLQTKHMVLPGSPTNALGKLSGGEAQRVKMLPGSPTDASGKVAYNRANTYHYFPGYRRFEDVMSYPPLSRIEDNKYTRPGGFRFRVACSPRLFYRGVYRLLPFLRRVNNQFVSRVLVIPRIIKRHIWQ